MTVGDAGQAKKKTWPVLCILFIWDYFLIEPTQSSVQEVYLFWQATESTFDGSFIEVEEA